MGFMMDIKKVIAYSTCSQMGVLIFCASAALMGLPFLSGYYSKEKILESSFYIFNDVNFMAFWLGSLSALFTAMYSTKLLYLSFFYKANNTISFNHFDFHLGNLHLNLIALYYTLIGFSFAFIIFSDEISIFFHRLMLKSNLEK